MVLLALCVGVLCGCGVKNPPNPANAGGDINDPIDSKVIKAVQRLIGGNKSAKEKIKEIFNVEGNIEAHDVEVTKTTKDLEGNKFAHFEDTITYSSPSKSSGLKKTFQHSGRLRYIKKTNAKGEEVVFCYRENIPEIRNRSSSN